MSLLQGLRSQFARAWRSSSSRPSTVKRKTTCLRMETLEAREVPAVLIQMDYSRDFSGFFNDPNARAVMDQVASELGNTLNASLAAIVPAGTNTWSPSFFDPSTGTVTSLSNLTIGANTIKVYAGARNLPGAEAGVGGFGGYSVSGTSTWISTVQTRGHTGFSPWGGSIAFDNADFNWHFGATTAGLDATELDFYSVATHEMGHLLGLGTSSQWANLTSSGFFVGPNASALYGGPVPLHSDNSHWADGTAVGGQVASLNPSIPPGTRVVWSPLDAAALRDLGWGTVQTASPPVKTETIGTATYTLNTLGNVYRQEVNGSPVLVATQITQIASGQGQFFMLGSDKNVYRYTPSGNVASVDTHNVTQIASGQGEFFVLLSNGNVYRYNAGAYVDSVNTQNITQIASGQGQFFVLRNDGNVYRYNAGAYVDSVNTHNVVQIASGQGEFFVLLTNGNVYRYNAGAYVVSVDSQNITQIASGQDQFFVLRNDGNVYRYNGGVYVDSINTHNVTQIASGQGQLFVLLTNGNVYRYDAGAYVISVDSQNITQIGSGQNEFFVLRSDGNVYRYHNGVFVDSVNTHNVTQISSSLGQFYVFLTDGHLYRYNLGVYVLVA